MTPFEEFRFWFRQGAGWERISAGVAAVIVVGLIAWVVVPANDDGPGTDSLAVSSGEPAAGAAEGSTEAAGPEGAGVTGPAGDAPAAGDAGAPVAGGTAGAPVAGAAPTSGAAPAGPAPAASSPQCPKGATDQGVTDTTISVGVLVLNVAGGNSLIGIPEVAEQKKQHDALIAHYNAKGGIKCRKIVPKYYSDNPLDANSERAICLDMAAAKHFAVIGALYQAQNSTCLAQAKLPSIAQTIRPTSEMRKFSPYIFTFYWDSLTNFNAYAVGSKEQGFFNGMTKLGVITGTCYPEYNDQFFAAMEKVGIGRDKMVTFDYGCPPASQAPPQVVAQAVLKFQQAGVNRVMTAGHTLASFSRQAQSQGYKPQYSVTSVDATMELGFGAGFAVDRENFDGALNITNSQYGALTTPGTPLSGATAECSAIMTKAGAQKPTDGIGYSGGTCNQWNILFLAGNKAPALQRTALVAGLNTVGRVEQSYPSAPATWNTPGKTWAGPSWRPLRYSAGCSCWKVVRAAFSDAT